MHTVWIILACFAGIFSFAFLTAGTLGLQDTPAPKSRPGALFQLLDGIVFGSIGSILRGFVMNWSTHRDERRLVYTGLICLAALIVFGGLASLTK